MPSRLVSVDSDTLYLPDEVRTALATYPELVAAIQSGARAQLPSFNIKHYGAVGNGSVDDTAAVLAAVAAAGAAGGGDVVVPYGTFKVAGTIAVPAGVTIRGTGKYGSIIATSSATATVFTLANAAGIRDLRITSSVARTAGFFVDVQGNQCFVDNCQLTEYWIGISVGTYSSTLAVAARMSNTSLSTTNITAGGAAIQLLHFANAIINEVVITGPTLPAQQPAAGIRVLNGDTCLISDTNVTQHGRALHVATPAGQHCFALSVVNSLFDSAGALVSGGTVSDVDFNLAGNAYDTKFANCWFGLSSAQSGVNLGPSGNVDGITFTGCEFVGNGQHGLLIATTTVKNVVVTGGFSAGNGQAGIFVAANVGQFIITGHRAGPAAARGANNYGINIIAGTSNEYIVQGCNTRGNTTSNLVDGGTGANKSVTGNLT